MVLLVVGTPVVVRTGRVCGRRRPTKRMMVHEVQKTVTNYRVHRMMSPFLWDCISVKWRAGQASVIVNVSISNK